MVFRICNLHEQIKHADLQYGSAPLTMQVLWVALVLPTDPPSRSPAQAGYARAPLL